MVRPARLVAGRRDRRLAGAAAQLRAAGAGLARRLRLGARAAAPRRGERRGWLQSALQPWRVESLDGQPVGLATGYFEPLIEASRLPRAGFQVPLYGPPSDLAHEEAVVHARADRIRHGGAQCAARARDRLRRRSARRAAAARAGLGPAAHRRARRPQAGRARRLRRPQRPALQIGRPLAGRARRVHARAGLVAGDQGLGAGPSGAGRRAALDANPRYVFFREEPLADPAAGPLGAQGVALTPGRSIAVDKSAVPYGTPVWLDTTEPQPGRRARRRRARCSASSSRRTPAAPSPAPCAPTTSGAGARAPRSAAGRMKQPLRMWVLVPRG